MEVLCRLDPATHKPVVFLTDTINNGKIQTWKGEGNPEYAPLAYYHVTVPLSAADERVLMERFKVATNRQDQLVKIRHRLPRSTRPLPNLLATPSAPSALPPAPAAKAAAKPRPTPEPEVVKAPTPLTVPATDLSSAAILDLIKEESTRLNHLPQLVAQLTQQLEQAAADHKKSQESYAILTAQYEAAIEREAAEDLKKRRDALTLVTQPPIDPVAQFAKDLQEAGAQPAGAQPNASTTEQQASAPAAQPAPQVARAPTGRFTKGNGKRKSAAKPIEAQKTKTVAHPAKQ